MYTVVFCYRIIRTTICIYTNQWC